MAGSWRPTRAVGRAGHGDPHERGRRWRCCARKVTGTHPRHPLRPLRDSARGVLPPGSLEPGRDAVLWDLRRVARDGGGRGSVEHVAAGRRWVPARRPRSGSGPPGSIPPSRSTSSRAIISLVLGIVALVSCGPVTGIPALYLGNMARREIRESGGRDESDGLALAGMITGGIGTALVGLTILASCVHRLPRDQRRAGVPARGQPDRRQLIAGAARRSGGLGRATRW
ncbi:MAG: DUF4190 domain-containing protein [Acidimicrobiia bacterium]|nr:DUF4190 domain-containing protein [Acidimicrobiia bacterium]